MAARKHRGPARHDVTVTITIGLMADPEKANTAGVDVSIEADGAAPIVRLLREAEARGELRPAVNVAVDAIARALGGYRLDSSVSAGKVGRA